MDKKQLIGQPIETLKNHIVLRHCIVKNLDTGMCWTTGVSYYRLKNVKSRIEILDPTTKISYIIQNGKIIDVIDNAKQDSYEIKDLYYDGNYFYFEALNDNDHVILQAYVPFIDDNKKQKLESIINEYVDKDEIPGETLRSLKAIVGEVILDDLGIIIKDGDYYLDKKPIPKALAKYLSKLIDTYSKANKLAYVVQAFVKFIRRLEKNPVGYIIDQLADFITRGRIPITKDGMILAYKKVNADYTSIWDDKTLHTPGSIVELPLEMCDTDPNRACSSGLHVCSYEYLPHYGAMEPEKVRIVVCEIDPADVVAVPNTETYKMRCRRYKVLYDVTQEALEKDILSEYGGIYLDNTK